QLIAAAYPTEQSPVHRFVFKNSQGVEQPEVRLSAAEVQVNSVQNLQYFTAANERKVAYFSFGSFNGTGEKELINTVNEINQTGVQELILDLRFNGGGYLDLASELAYMVGGDGVKKTSVFSALRFAPGNTEYRDEVIPFWPTSRALSSDVAKDQPLPTLNLKRLYVLTSASTCSASESLINGLRGADFPVVQVGTTTCGKPYGMVPLSNCGFDYYTINFRYENAKGFSEFESGLAPRNSVQTQGSPLGCEVADQYRDPLGSANESLLAAALKHIDSGSCGSAALAAPRAQGSSLPHPNPVFSNAIGPRLSF
ncbi:MAG TPA: S41 family peptidase, partial [Cellvibrionaceae bacterium]|nr:S41 family peptidase [Cellvibrionaceae bacterium]